MKKLLTLLLLLAPSVLAQNPVSGGPIPQSTYTTPSTIGGGGGGISYGLGSGTAQAQIIASPSPTIGALTNGVQVCWLPVAANTAAAPTLQVGTLAAKPITKYGTVALVANDITTVGIACAIYDGTEFQLQVPLAGGVFSSSISAGSGASAAGATATGGFAAVEGASTGWTPTAGQDYCRADSTVHNFVCSINGAAEQPSVVFTPSLTGMGGTGSGTGIQGLGTGINIVSPQSKQIDLQNNGSNGGATFRFLDDFATGDQELRLWATGGTGYDVLMASGAGGTPLGLILATQGSTFISMRPNNLAETVRFPGSGGIQLGTGQDVGISRDAASILDVGNGTQGDVTGTLKAAAYLPASTTHALTMPVTIGSGTSIGSTILCAAADCPAGTYEIPTYIDITTPCGTTGTYVVNLIYTDDQGAKTIPVNINGTGAVPATGVLTTTSTANFGEDVQVIRVASGNVNYSTTATACGTAGPMVGKLYMTADRKM